MTNLKKIIIILIIIIISIIIILLSFIYFKRGEIIYEVDETGSEEELYNIDSSLQLVTVRNDFYAVKSCVEKFYTYYSSLYDNGENYNEVYGMSSLEIEEENKQAVYDMLDLDYINYKGINKNNILDKIEELKYSVVNINEMYVSKRDINMYIYVVYGTLREVKSGNVSDFKLMIKLDALNKSFKVFLEDYIEQKYKNIRDDDQIEIKVESAIERNDNNIYDYKIINDEVYVNDLFAKYKEEILFDFQNAYNHLDKEYRETRFESIDNFRNYLKDNIIKNVTMQIDKFQKNVYDDYTEYVCLDQNGKYYIFNEIATMNYNLILDTYTVNLPSFVQKYNQGNEQIKIGMNVQKIIDAVNAKDYKYVYNKLDKTFKTNNFNNIDVFIQFIENNFFEFNQVNYKDFSNVGGVYTYKLKIINEENLEEYKDIIIVVKLLDNMDFVMSFNI